MTTSRLLALVVALAPVAAGAEGTIRVDATPAHVVNSFSPARALGAGIDRMSSQVIDAAYRPEVIKQVLGAGWQHVSYRLNTELHVEDWHWNPRGSWSDPAGRGYFVGSAEPGEPIIHSYGYPLPHRGDTHNEGTEREGYSRLTDGDLRSYWKSNPYLTRDFTGEDDAVFPQWIVIDLERARPVNAMRIAWGDPFARAYEIQYWSGADALKQPTQGEWRTFSDGKISDGKGGTVTHVLDATPAPVRFVRLVMRDSSETCDSHGAADRRNCVGYAIRELYLGTKSARGPFRDLLAHAPSQQQGATYCSSVDPWHAPSDINKRGTQSGLDLFYDSGVTRGQPAMIPVAVVYSTPENAAAEIAYLGKRGRPISYVEMGEEPDGQYMTPEHYAALYLQFATAIHKVDPKLKLGGPAFTGQNEDILVWPDGHGSGSWLGRFLAYVKAHGRLSDFAFLSFEHYPYLPCKGSWADLYDEPHLISHIMQTWRDDGLPPEVPMLVTELNVSWECDQRFVEPWGALWLADYVGAFFTAGGAESFFFHYLPEGLSHDCGTWGTFAMLLAEGGYQKLQPLAQYFAAQLITGAWVQPGEAIHRVYRATSDIADDAGHALVTAYALSRPDGKWSLLIVNKDEARAHAVRVRFHDDGAGREQTFSGPVEITSFGPDNYAWHANGARGYAKPDGPPSVVTRDAAPSSTPLSRPLSTIEYTLPRASLVVLTGALAALPAE
jgi:hypothetical protein